MKLKIKPEDKSDIESVYHIVKKAFEGKEYSDQTEHLLVDKLRASTSFIKELSLVAEYDGKLIGHILLTKLHLKHNSKILTGLALAPVSVLPKHQNKGVGSQLINNAHKVAEQMGFPFIVLIGHPEYYRKFGYTNLNAQKIKLPFDVPNAYCFILKLSNAADLYFEGEMIYDSCFFD